MDKEKETIENTMAFLNTLCESSEQKQMLDWMMQQPKEQLVSFLKSSIATLPREALPELINTHMASHPVETRNMVYSQVLQAYDFLKGENGNVGGG